MEHRIIDQPLGVLQEKLMALGAATEAAVERSMQALTTRDSELAQRVLDEDVAINQMELEIDRMSIEILALQQPAAHDLRFVISVAKITPILERIADHAGNIAESALVLNNEPRIKDYVDFPQMAEIARKMLRDSLDAFTREDADASREIIKRDKTIDEAYHRVFNELLEQMIEDPSLTTCAAHLLFVAKHLERIGDYVKDICELNVYLREAAFIKHSM
ncbi:MAG: phosphate signaling complex protein PhoU [Pyrinomonadaceae bacterium]